MTREIKRGRGTGQKSGNSHHSFKHGSCFTKEYRSWHMMKERCLNPNNNSYANYGGRGIVVCERWRNSFSAFFEDMGQRPRGHSLDRIDNDGNYEPSNCRWATSSQQLRNTGDSVCLTFNGRTMHRFDWADRIGISRSAIVSRCRRGWPVEKILTQKPYLNTGLTHKKGGAS